ncbi:MAG: 2Fe-2S iron-sulfur cluster binding domain-containing protein [Proteobacteria bacterium]|nr:2Fe-2S iron-sulfur cluster binding domain-containing protein [Pseudomonadota bacterium]
MNGTITLTVNSVKHAVTCTGKESLLEILRDHLELTGVKEGCGYGACGSCTVVVNGKAVNACVFKGKEKLQGIEVLTIEGLADRDGNLHPIQESFLEAGAVQCGFCTAGFIMRLYALFKKKSNAPEEVIQAELSKHLCRCTGYEAIWEASLLAQKRLNT